MSDEADMRVIVGSALPADLGLVALIRLYCALTSLSASLQGDVGDDGSGESSQSNFHGVPSRTLLEVLDPGAKRVLRRTIFRPETFDG